MIELYREQREQVSQEIQASGWEERSLLGTGWFRMGENSRRWALELSISEQSVSGSPVGRTSWSPRGCSVMEKLDSHRGKLEFLTLVL